MPRQVRIHYLIGGGNAPRQSGGWPGLAWLQSACTLRLNHRHKLIGHVLQQDTPAARQELERRTEARRLEPGDEETLKALRRGCLSSEEFNSKSSKRWTARWGSTTSGKRGWRWPRPRFRGIIPT